MADEQNTPTPEVAPQAAESDDKMVPFPVSVTAQEAKVVDNDGAEPMVVEPEVNKDQVDAMLVQPREADADKVNVHETYVVTDRVITDPSDPLAVQVPPEGRGDASLPIHRLARGSVEDIFRKEASSSNE